MLDLYSGHNKTFFVTFFCSFTLVPYCKQVVCFVTYFTTLFSLCHVCYYCGVTTMLLIHPHFSPITAIKVYTFSKSPLASWWNLPSEKMPHLLWRHLGLVFGSPARTLTLAAGLQWVGSRTCFVRRFLHLPPDHIRVSLFIPAHKVYTFSNEIIITNKIKCIRCSCVTVKSPTKTFLW
jgi:hypothetical protein